MKSDYEVSLERQSPVVLSVKHVAKSFRLPTEQASGLKMAFLNWTKGIKGTPSSMCCETLRSMSDEVIFRHCWPKWLR